VRAYCCHGVTATSVRALHVQQVQRRKWHGVRQVLLAVGCFCLFSLAATITLYLQDPKAPHKPARKVAAPRTPP